MKKLISVQDVFGLTVVIGLVCNFGNAEVLQPTATAMPTTIISTPETVNPNKNSSADQYVNPVLFSVAITAKSKDSNDVPAFMTLDPNGGVYVLTGRSFELFHLDKDGNVKESSNSVIEKPISHDRVSGFIVDKDGNFFFWKNNYYGLHKFTITKYDKSMKLVKEWFVNSKSKVDSFVSLKFDSNGFLWLLRGDCSVTKFDSNLSPIQTTQLKPELNLIYPSVFHPQDFDFDSKGNLYIVTFQNYIFKFSPNGKCLGSFGGCGATTGHLAWPNAISCGLDNCFYVSDSIDNRIEKFDTNGQFLTQWNVGQILVKQGLAVDDHNDIWILSVNNVMKFSCSLVQKDMGYFASENQKKDESAPRRTCFTLDENGDPCEDFWKYPLQPPLPDEGELKSINTPNSLLPFLKANPPIVEIYHFVNDPDNDDSADTEMADAKYTVKDFKKFNNEIKTFGDLGFDLSYDNVGGSEDLERSQKTEWGYLWGLYDCLYFVPTNQPNTAFFIEDGMNHVDKMEMEYLGKDWYRVIVWFHGDAGGAFINIYDLDLINRKISSIGFDAFMTGDELLRLKKDQHYSLVEIQIVEDVKWPWIFSWENNRWVNSSAEYPDFYKTEGVSIISDNVYWNQLHDLTEDQQTVQYSLLDAAKNGGPAAFIKPSNTHKFP